MFQTSRPLGNTKKVLKQMKDASTAGRAEKGCGMQGQVNRDLIS